MKMNLRKVSLQWLESLIRSLWFGQTKSVTSTDVGSPRESEAEDSSVSSKDQLRARVDSLERSCSFSPVLSS